MDSVLHTLYYTYLFINGICSKENIQFADRLYNVELVTNEYHVRLTKIDTLNYIKEPNVRVVEYACLDEESYAWIFKYEKTLYGYKLLFKQEDDPELIILISNQKICK